MEKGEAFAAPFARELCYGDFVVSLPSDYLKTSYIEVIGYLVSVI